MNKKTVVIGVSTNPERYSYKAVSQLLAHGYEVVALGLREGELFGLKIKTDYPILDDVHTVTLYVGKDNQKGIIDYVLKLKPQRVIFNPGTENSEFENKLIEKAIVAERACTLVLLSIGAY